MDQNIPFNDTGFYSKLVLDYLLGHDGVKKYHSYAHNIDGIIEAIQNREFCEANRTILHQSIQLQYADAGLLIDVKSEVGQNIKALLSPNTFTITTGHQLCILSGPLYVAIKILHTIKIAQTFSNKERKLVPVFWLASEDHDFDEIKTVNINHQNYTWNEAYTNVPVGLIKPNSIAGLIEEIERNNPQMKDALQELAQCYKTASNLSDATRHWAHKWFGKYGLVVIDANRKELKALFADVIAIDVCKQEVIDLVQKQNADIEKNGYRAQVNGREINHFYLHNGKRHLIKRVLETYVLDGVEKIWTQQQMLDEVSQYPERFSPNVVMRPLYQEQILPNVAYVGGPGELAYWLQLKPLFNRFQIPYPFLAARASFVMANTQTIRQVKKLKLSWKDLLNSTDQTKHVLLQKWAPTSEKEASMQINKILQQLIDEANSVDNGIAADVLAYMSTQKQYFEKITKRLNKAKRKKLEIQLQIFDQLQTFLLPNAAPQERVFNLLSFHHDVRFVVDLLYRNIDPITTEVKVLTY